MLHQVNDELWVRLEKVNAINFFRRQHNAFIRCDGGDYPCTIEQAEKLLAVINGAPALAVVESDAVTLPIIAPTQTDTSLTAFKAMLQTGDYVVLDTETTGLEDGEICQIAIIDAGGNVLLDTLVRTKEAIPSDATRIHGITNEMVANSPTWESVRELVYAALKGRHVVIYNAVYDRKMMHKSSERWGLPKTEWKEVATFWDAMAYCAEIYGDWNSYRGNYRWQKLSTMAAYYEIPESAAHSALGDVQTTLAICKAMLEKRAD